MPVMLARLLLVLALAFGAFGLSGTDLSHGGRAHAQEPGGSVDYEAWQRDATRAENAVSSARASNQIFEQLRTEIAAWRDRFLAAQDSNAARIRTLRNQIEALGPPPADGTTETEEIAARRTDLNDQLNAALAPVKRAEEAYSRADGLVQEIDGIIRERQTNELLKLGPTPLNPVLWPGALAALTESALSLGTEVAQAWRSEIKRASFRADLPITLLYLLVAAILLVRGRSLMVRITAWVMEKSHGRARRVAGFTASLGQIVLPILGIFLLVAALKSTGLLGLRGEKITESLAVFGLFVFGARWLALRLFPLRTDRKALVAVTPRDGAYLRFYITSLGAMMGLLALLGEIAELDSYSDDVLTVLAFPLAVVIAFLLFRIGRLLRRTADAIRHDTASGEPAFGARVMGLVGRLVILLSVVGVVLTAVGYFNAGFFLLRPVALTLALFGLLVVLTDLIGELYALVTRTDSARVSEALVPTLLSLVLVLLSLPILALIWGARVADLTELWAKFQEGFDIGGTRISPSNFMTFAVVFTTLFVVTRLVQSAMRTSVLPKTKMDAGGRNAVTSGIGYIGIFLAAVVAITTAGIDLSSLAIVAGALSVGIGFGLQNIVSNFVSGIILLIERPISEGDWIEVNGQHGTVREISVRSTRIQTFDRSDMIIPNADLVTGTVTNYTRGNTIGRLIVSVGVGYETDTHQVEKILMEIAEAQPIALVNPAPYVVFSGIGAETFNFELRIYLSDVNFTLSVRTAVYHEIVRRFREEGIEMPYATRDLWLRNPESLRDTPAQDGGPESEGQSGGPGLSGATADLLRTPSRPVVNRPDDDDDDGDGDGGDAR